MECCIGKCTIATTYSSSYCLTFFYLTVYIFLFFYMHVCAFSLRSPRSLTDLAPVGTKLLPTPLPLPLLSTLVLPYSTLRNPINVSLYGIHSVVRHGRRSFYHLLNTLALYHYNMPHTRHTHHIHHIKLLPSPRSHHIY